MVMITNPSTGLDFLKGFLFALWNGFSGQAPNDGWTRVWTTIGALLALWFYIRKSHQQTARSRGSDPCARSAGG